MAWLVDKLYIPAPYNRPGMAQQVRTTILTRLSGPEALQQALETGWLQELPTRPDGLRRFAIQLTDRRSYAPIPISFVLRDDASPLR